MDASLIVAGLMAGFSGLLTRLRSRDAVLGRAAAMGWTMLAVSAVLTLASALGLLAADGASLIALLLTAFVGATVLSFSRRYLRADPDVRGYAAKVLLLLGAIALFAGARDLVSLAIGWIASGWLLTLLIGHASHWPEARAARRRALATFATGDVALIAGLGLIAIDAGSIRIDALKAAPSLMTTAGAILIVIAAAVRCALPPFQRWLNRSMTAPTPVSALMHAGFVNGGGLLLIRLAPALEAAPVARALAIAIGLAAALIGTGVMLVRPDIKRSLAGSTTAQMGFMLMTCGLGAYAAALWHLVAHGLFKAWLFLQSGSAIGIGQREVPVALPSAAVAAFGLVAVIASAALSLGSPAAGVIVPLTLALATAIATVPRVLTQPAFAAPAVAIVAAYAGGVMAFDRLLAHPSGPALGGAWLPPAIVAVFMAAWLIQTFVTSGRLLLPASLYARLLRA